MSYFKISNEIIGAYSVPDYDVIDLFGSIQDYCNSRYDCNNCLFRTYYSCFFTNVPNHWEVDYLREKVKDLAD